MENKFLNSYPRILSTFIVDNEIKSVDRIKKIFVVDCNCYFIIFNYYKRRFKNIYYNEIT